VSKFSASPLKALDRIYRFVGGLSGLREFELEGPIQPVHDLSRQSELDPQLGVQGYFTVGQGQVHAGAGTLNGDYDPYAAGVLPVAPGLEPAEIGVWVMSALQFTDTAGTFVIGNQTYTFPTVAGAFQGGVEQLLFSFNDEIDIVATGGEMLCGDSARVTNQVPLPFFLPVGGTLTTQSEASAAATIRSIITYWAGPLGTRPPGIA